MEEFLYVVETVTNGVVSTVLPRVVAYSSDYVHLGLRIK